MTQPTHLHRRAFLTGCLAATGVGLCRLPAAPGPFSAALQSIFWFQPTLAMLTKADFDACLGSQFQAQIAPGQSAPMELIEVSGYPASATRPGAAREPFSLVFRGGKSLELSSQQIFKLEHPKLGVHEIFLVPIGTDDRGMRFEAVFS